MTTPTLPRIKRNSVIYITGGNVRWYGLSGKERVPLKTKHTASIQSSIAPLGIYPREIKTYVYIESYRRILIQLYS